MAPMGNEDPLGVNGSHDQRSELGGIANAFYRPIQAPAETIRQGAVPWSAGKEQKGALLGM